MNQVYAALVSETMVVESMFLERSEEADYLIFYTRAESLEKANQMMQSSRNQVDIEALEIIQKTWESVQPLEILFDVDRIEKVRQ